MMQSLAEGMAALAGLAPMIIRRSSDISTRLWSGGTTRELFIAPADSDYADRNFQFRLSTATVESEECLFTSLAGYERHLMVLAGAARLEHQGHHASNLGPFDVDTFDGAWSTQSQGLYRDFNLLVRYGSRGYLTHQRLREQETLHLSPEPGLLRAWYLISGRLELVSGEILSADDLLVIEPGDRLGLRSLQASQLVVSTIAF